MPQSLSKILVHLIFSTKNRDALIQKAVRPELHKYMNGILKDWDSPAIIIGSVADHAHLLFRLSKNHALSKIVEHVKKGSSKWIKTQGARYTDFHWQAGYGAFSEGTQGVALGWNVSAFQAGSELLLPRSPAWKPPPYKPIAIACPPQPTFHCQPSTQSRQSGQTRSSLPAIP